MKSVMIVETNLSIAWARAFLETMGAPQVAPLVVTVTGLDRDDFPEVAGIRAVLDSDMVESVGFDTNTVANTIFPESLWNPARPREDLFERYRRILPQIKGCKSPKPQSEKFSQPNKYGVYFERMIAYRPKDAEGRPWNQLDHVITTFRKGNHRFSGLQASIFDPHADHTDQQMRGFPCLQQVGFQPVDDGGLVVVGFYPKQYVYDRGYGNYLGLMRLGRFMAHEMGLKLTQMTCFVGVGVVGSKSKTDLQPLTSLIKSELGKATA